MAYNLVKGDAVKWAKEYAGELFHALLCDPPYHMASGYMSVDWGSYNHPKGVTNEGGRGHKKGFMGQKWDGGDVAFNAETWDAFKGVMYPGAFGMAFASSRGWHRLAAAIEDAGFVIHPTIFGWGQGQGFPKATRLDTRIDREAGVEPRVIGSVKKLASAAKVHEGWERPWAYDEDGEPKRTMEITEAVTPMAKAWVGYRYGLQALKPALEPIIVFQKPYEGKPIENMVDTGAGALNIDGCRVNVAEDEPNKREKTGAYNSSRRFDGDFQINHQRPATLTLGRWPANLILLDDKAAEVLDAQSGNRPSATNRKPTVGSHFTAGNGKDNGRVVYANGAPYDGETGGVSRFFYKVEERLDEADPVYYVPKPSRRERDAGLDGMELHEGGTWGKGIGNLSGSDVSKRNPHPTIKPIALARYLAKLLLPPTEYNPRRMFIPFAGVASEMIGALQAGWDFVQGVELGEAEVDYVEVAMARLNYYTRVI